MIAYAGAGSKYITEEESLTISKLAENLSKLGYTLYSGNSEGAEIAFQRGAGINAVISLPAPDFNYDLYEIPEEVPVIYTGHWFKGREALALSMGYYSSNTTILMVRQYTQVMGYFISDYPPAKFVVFCDDKYRKGKKRAGITKHILNIANWFKIPCVNIREEGWKLKLAEILKTIPR